LPQYGFHAAVEIERAARTHVNDNNPSIAQAGLCLVPSKR